VYLKRKGVPKRRLGISPRATICRGAPIRVHCNIANRNRVVKRPKPGREDFVPAGRLVPFMS